MWFAKHLRGVHLFAYQIVPFFASILCDLFIPNSDLHRSGLSCDIYIREVNHCFQQSAYRAGLQSFVINLTHVNDG